MPVSSYIQTNFTAGEQSPRLRGRVDIAKYSNGARTIENFKVMAHGGLEKREGSVYVNEVRDSTKKTRLIPFEFSTEQAYTLEFGEKYIRIFLNNGQQTDSHAITGITQANPAVVTMNLEKNQRTGDKVDLSSIGGMTELNGNTYTITRITDVTFSLDGVDSTGFGAYTSGGTAVRPFSLQTPWLEAELFDLQFAQSADVMWITHPNVKPQKLSRITATSWSLDAYVPISDPFVPSFTVTITGATNAEPCEIIAPDMNGVITGSRVTIKGMVGLTEFNNKTFIVTRIDNDSFTIDFSNTTSSPTYVSGGEVLRGVLDHPRAVGFFEKRLWFGGTANEPHKIWATVAGDYEDLTVGTNDDDALEYVIASGKVNAIHWLSGVESLLVGTSGAEFRVSGGNLPVTPTNISVKLQTSYRSATQQPIEIDNNVVFVQGARKKIREMTFSFDIDGYRASDLTILSEHITGSGITEIDYKREPDPIIWGARDDGQLVGLTYEKPQEVIGWHRHIFGGVSAKVDSVAVIPTSTHDQLWVIVQRTVNGASVRYVEYLNSDDWTDMDDMFYVDSGLTYDSTPVTTISGLDHLEGETIQLLVDGASHPDKTVASGSVTLERSGSVVQAGLKYTAKFENLEPEGGNPAGTSQSKKKSWASLNLRVYQTLGGTVNGNDIPYNKTDAIMDAPPPLFSGDIEITDLGSSKQALLTITHDTPFPMTLLAFMGNLKVSNG